MVLGFIYCCVEYKIIILNRIFFCSRVGNYCWLVRVSLFILVILLVNFTMEIVDSVLSWNRYWDPSYLALLFSEDFYDFTDLWMSNVSDSDLVNSEKNIDIYCQMVEDISLLSKDKANLLHTIFNC